MLDIDQCPDKYYVPNAFKDTHKCDDRSSYVSKFENINNAIPSKILSHFGEGERLGDLKTRGWKGLKIMTSFLGGKVPYEARMTRGGGGEKVLKYEAVGNYQNVGNYQEVGNYQNVGNYQSVWK